MMREVGDRGGKIDEATEKETTRFNDTSSEREVTDEREKLPFGARGAITPRTKRNQESGELVSRQAETTRGSVDFNAKKGDDGRRAFDLPLGEGNAEKPKESEDGGESTVTGRIRRRTKEEIVEIMDEKGNTKEEKAAPLESVGKGVENERRRTKTKRQARIEIKRTEPVKTKKRPFRGTNRAETKGMTNIELGHEWCGAGVTNESDGIVEGAILDGELGDVNAPVDRCIMMTGKVENETIRPTLLRNDTKRRRVKVRKGREGKWAVGVATRNLLRDSVRDLRTEGTGGGQIGDATATDGSVDTQRKTKSETREKERGERRIRVVTQQRGEAANVNGRRDERRNERPKRVEKKSRRQERVHHRSDRRARNDRRDRSRRRWTGRSDRRQREVRVAERKRSETAGEAGRAWWAHAGGHERAARKTQKNAQRREEQDRRSQNDQAGSRKSRGAKDRPAKTKAQQRRQKTKPKEREQRRERQRLAHRKKNKARARPGQWRPKTCGDGTKRGYGET